MDLYSSSSNSTNLDFENSNSILFIKFNINIGKNNAKKILLYNSPRLKPKNSRLEDLFSIQLS